MPYIPQGKKDYRKNSIMENIRLIKGCGFYCLFGVLIFALYILLSSPLFAEDGKDCSIISKETIKNALRKLNVTSAEILSVKQTPLDGICEIVVQDKAGIHVFYTDNRLDYLLLGPLVETKSMTNLTAQTAQKIQDQKRIDLSKIPLDETLVMGDKKAVKKLVIFTDPDCKYCSELHQTIKNIIAKRKDVAFFIKLFPLSIHKEAYWKAKSIICKKSLSLLEDCFAGKSIEKTDCDTKEVDETIKLAASLGITGTPTLILPDGRLRVGAYPENDLISLIDGKI